MLLNIAKAYKMLQFGENKAYALNEVISVLLRHAQRHSSKFLFWISSLELHKKILGSQNDACVFVKNEMNIFLLIQFCYLAEIQNLLKFGFFFFLVIKNKFRTSRLPKYMVHVTHLITCGHFWLLYISNVKKNTGKKQKDLRLCWPLILLSINLFILLNRNSYLLAKC